jgi:hypothetical protein
MGKEVPRWNDRLLNYLIRRKIKRWNKRKIRKGKIKMKGSRKKRRINKREGNRKKSGKNEII